MRARIAIFATAAAAGAALLGGCGGGGRATQHAEPVRGEPSVDIVSPRNGARQASHAVVVKVEIHNFHLSPRSFGSEPQLGEGSIRFGLSQLPACISPQKLARAEANPVSHGHLGGKSFDYGRYAGPNGVLAERIGSAGSYSPATRPEIYYHDLPVGIYHLNVTLAQNNGAPTPYHGLTNFEIMPPPGTPPLHCPSGKVPSARAASLE